MLKHIHTRQPNQHIERSGKPSVEGAPEHKGLAEECTLKLTGHRSWFEVVSDTAPELMQSR